MDLLVGGDSLVYIRIDSVCAPFYVFGSLVVRLRVSAVASAPAPLSAAVAGVGSARTASAPSLLILTALLRTPLRLLLSSLCSSGPSVTAFLRSSALIVSGLVSPLFALFLFHQYHLAK